VDTLKWAKRGLAFVLLVVLLYLFRPMLSEFGDAAGLVRNADWRWLPVVLLVQIVSYFSLSWLNLLSIQPFPGRISLFKMAGILTSIAFIEVAIPSAGASGVVLRVRLLKKHGGYQFEAATFSMILENTIVAIGLSTIGVLGVSYLFRTGGVAIEDIVRLVGLAALAGGLLYIGWRLLQDVERSQAVLRVSVRLWNRVVGKMKTIDEARAFLRLAEFRQNLKAYTGIPVWKFLAAASGRVVLDVATLGVCFLLYRYAVRPGVLLTGYGLVLLISGLTSLPGGLALIDLSVPVIFERLGAPGSVAIAAGLTYRLVSFWLLRLVGFVNWVILEERSG
jgi:uncharacterized protein (TIRG00374 family)